MNLNLTVNESTSCGAPTTPGTYSVRVWYDENTAGHLYGPFSCKERAEQCVLVLAGRPGVIKAAVEGA